MKKLRFAQIGTEHDHAAEIYRTFRDLDEVFDVAGFCTVDEEGTAAYEARRELFDGTPRLTLDEILSDPSLDCVAVETGDLLLTKYAALALERGLPVQMDKPGAPDEASFDALMDLSVKKKVPIQLGYMYRFHPAVCEMKNRIEAGDLGDLLYLNTEMNCLHGAGKRAWLGDFPGGMMYYLGCHLIDVIYRVQGEPEEVIPLNTSSGKDGVTALDEGFAAFRYPRGVSFARTTAVERGGYRRRQIVAVGTKGTCEIRPTEYMEKPKDWETLHSDVRYVIDPPVEPFTTPRFHRYADMLRSFGEIASGRKENPYAPDYEKNLHRLILRACGAK